MKKQALVIAVVLLSCSFFLSPLLSDAGEKPKVSLYFLIHSGACPCQQEACSFAKPIAGFVQNHLAAGVEYQELDYGIRPETVDPLIRQYQIFTFPAFLAVGANKVELLKIQGRMRRDDVLKKLFDAGLITGVN
ncbi:MAG: hypothetical protein GX444_10290 [Myxococcales bacterium]|nr:hypothetical protein [Myxococcales bacterium]